MLSAASFAEETRGHQILRFEIFMVRDQLTGGDI